MECLAAGFMAQNRVLNFLENERDKNYVIRQLENQFNVHEGITFSKSWKI